MVEDLYEGAEVLVDYKSQLNQDVTDYFEEASNFKGFAIISTIDEDEGICTIEGLANTYISLEYIYTLELEC